ncbi:MAG: M48 family metallopeptidase [Anaerolineaceae bacterium]|nr:M48 family metallopeptidase [Anaerolineaceae bacterium]
MGEQIMVGSILVEVIFKDIKNVHLSVHPPTGRIRIAAPEHTSLDTLRVYAISKLNWIRKAQAKLQAQERETQREYIDRESHYLWGSRYLLRVNEVERPPSVTLRHNEILLSVRPNSDRAKREEVISAWYREEVRKAVEPIIPQWEKEMAVRVNQLFVQRMKTRWGSCNPHKGNIRLNTELAKKPRNCLEYILVHEMVHLLEPTHNTQYTKLMDQFMPQWRHYRDELNQAPLGYMLSDRRNE